MFTISEHFFIHPCKRFHLLYLKDFFTSTNFHFLFQNYSISEQIILSDKNSLFSNVSVDYYLKFMKTNMKIKENFSQSSYQNYVNASDIRSIVSSNYGYGIEFRSGYIGMMNFHIGTKWDEVQFETENIYNYVNNRSFANINFRFNAKILATLRIERYYFGYLTQ